MVTVEWMWNLVAFVFTIAVWSVAFRDNPLYRFVEHTLVGAMGGYFTLVTINAILRGGISPIYDAGKVSLIVPIILGLLVFTSYIRRWSWLYRYPIAVVVSTGTALAMRTVIQAQFASQIGQTMLPIFTSDPIVGFSNLLVIIGTISCLAYFIFTASQKGTLGKCFGYTNKVARIFLMAAFGVGFVTFFTSAFTFLIERVSYVVGFLLGS